MLHMTLLQWKNKRRLGDNIEYNNIYDTVVDADAIFHITKWKESECLTGKSKVHEYTTSYRNVFDKDALEGFTYLKIG